MLRACRQVLRPRGRIAYYTIFIPPGLSAGDRRRAAIAGPPCVGSRAAQRALLSSAGFTEISTTDESAEFLRVAREWRASRDRHEAELRAVQGDARFEEQRDDNLRGIRAIEAGLLRRALFTAVRPAARHGHDRNANPRPRMR